MASSHTYIRRSAPLLSFDFPDIGQSVEVVFEFDLSVFFDLQIELFDGVVCIVEEGLLPTGAISYG